MKGFDRYFLLAGVGLCLACLVALPIACGQNLSNPTATSGAITATPTATPIPNIGVLWKQVTSSAAFGNRVESAAVSFSSKLWVIAGESSGGWTNDVWSSPDGLSWTSSGSASFSVRSFHTALVYNGQMWVIGGSDTGISAYYNDVWSSSDGSSWTNPLTNNPSPGTSQFSQRNQMGSAVFNNRMWIIGGYDGSNYYNDVWSSADGVTWTNVLANAPSPGSGQFSQRKAAAVLVYNGLLWVLGGINGSSYYNDVWSSPDGVNWTQVLATGASQTNQFGASDTGTNVYVTNNLMWAISGTSTRNLLDTVWYSSNGSTWTEASAGTPIGIRYYYGMAFFNDQIYLLGGQTCNIGCGLADIWTSP